MIVQLLGPSVYETHASCQLSVNIRTASVRAFSAAMCGMD